jgi:hypothetical protein
MFCSHTLSSTGGILTLILNKCAKQKLFHNKFNKNFQILRLIEQEWAINRFDDEHNGERKNIGLVISFFCGKEWKNFFICCPCFCYWKKLVFLSFSSLIMQVQRHSLLQLHAHAQVEPWNMFHGTWVCECVYVCLCVWVCVRVHAQSCARRCWINRTSMSTIYSESQICFHYKNDLAYRKWFLEIHVELVNFGISIRLIIQRFAIENFFSVLILFKTDL